MQVHYLNVLILMVFLVVQVYSKILLKCEMVDREQNVRQRSTMTLLVMVAKLH